MRPLDWLIAVPGVLALSGWLIEQIIAFRRSYRAARQVIIEASSRPARSQAAVLTAGPPASARRPDPGQAAGAGPQMVGSPGPSCWPRATKQQISGGLIWREPEPAGHERMPRRGLGPPRPGGSWPQPSLN